MHYIIGITGPARSGKDTFAGVLDATNQRMRDGVHVFGFAFAEEVKRLAAIVYFVDPVNFESRKSRICRKYNMTYRELLQKFGTDFARDMISEDFWVDRMDDKYSAMLKKNQGSDTLSLITDVRFENEAEWVRSKGGIIVEMVRPGTGGDNHKSEAPLPDHIPRHKVANTGEIKDLIPSAERILHLLYS